MIYLLRKEESFVNLGGYALGSLSEVYVIEPWYTYNGSVGRHLRLIPIL